MAANGPGVCEPGARARRLRFCLSASGVTKLQVRRREPQATVAANTVLGVCDVLRSPNQKTSGDDKRLSSPSAHNTSPQAQCPSSPKHNAQTGRGGYPSGQKQTGYRKHEFTCRGGINNCAAPQPGTLPLHGWENASPGRLLQIQGETRSKHTGGGLSSHKRQGPLCF